MWTTLLSVIVVLLWPLALSTAAWVIAFQALNEPDEISDVVGALTGRSAIKTNATRRKNSIVIAARDRPRAQADHSLEYAS